MSLPNLNFFRDDLRLTTWLLVGACLQSLLVLSLPRYVALLPAALVLGARFLVNLLMTQGFVHNAGSEGVYQGRATAMIPLEDGSFPDKASDHEIVLFIVSTRSSQYVWSPFPIAGPLDPFSAELNLTVWYSAQGRFAPGYIAAGDYFQAMLKEAERNDLQWGCRLCSDVGCYS